MSDTISISEKQPVESVSPGIHMPTGKDSEEQNSPIGKQEVTPILPKGLIAVYRPSDGQLVIFSRESLSNKESMRAGGVNDRYHYCS